MWWLSSGLLIGRFFFRVCISGFSFGLLVWQFFLGLNMWSVFFGLGDGSVSRCFGHLPVYLVFVYVVILLRVLTGRFSVCLFICCFLLLFSVVVVLRFVDRSIF